MSLYELPARNPLAKPFRILGGASIFLLLCLLGISLWDPPWLTDPARHILGYVGVAILISMIIVSFVVSGKIGIWKWKRSFQVELENDRIVLMRADHPDVEIPINEIHSIEEIAGWLFIRGGQPQRSMAIPRELRDYEGLRQELANRHEIVRGRHKMSPMFFLQAAVSPLIGLAALYLSFTARDHSVRLASEVVLLLWFTWGFFALVKLGRAKKKGFLVLSLYLLAWTALAWVFLKNYVR